MSACFHSHVQGSHRLGSCLNLCCNFLLSMVLHRITCFYERTKTIAKWNHKRIKPFENLCCENVFRVMKQIKVFMHDLIHFQIVMKSYQIYWELDVIILWILTRKGVDNVSLKLLYLDGRLLPGIKRKMGRKSRKHFCLDLASEIDRILGSAFILLHG